MTPDYFLKIFFYLLLYVIIYTCICSTVFLIFQGIAFVNGVNIGRYWPHEGPQVRLYVPKFALQKGHNEIGLLEVEKCLCEDTPCFVTFHDKPLINSTVPSSNNKGHFITDRMAYRGNLNHTVNDTNVHKTSVLQVMYKWLMVLVDNKWGILLI